MVPQVEHMQQFGCIAYAHIDSTLRSSIEPTSIKCIFLGYTQYQKAYVLAQESDKKIIVCRNVTFSDSLTDIPSNSPISTSDPVEIIDDHGFEVNGTQQRNDDLPVTYAEAINRKDGDKWHQASTEELQAHLINRTWTLVDQPVGVHSHQGAMDLYQKEVVKRRRELQSKVRGKRILPDLRD